MLHGRFRRPSALVLARLRDDPRGDAGAGRAIRTARDARRGGGRRVRGDARRKGPRSGCSMPAPKSCTSRSPATSRRFACRSAADWWAAVHATACRSTCPTAMRDPRFNAEVDRRSGFHTRCCLTLPLIDHLGTLVGVMQLLNKQQRCLRRWRPGIGRGARRAMRGGAVACAHDPGLDSRRVDAPGTGIGQRRTAQHLAGDDAGAGGLRHACRLPARLADRRRHL